MYEIEMQTLDEQSTIVARGKVRAVDLPEWFGRAFAATADAIARGRGLTAGPPFARIRPLGEAQFDVEAGFPVVDPVPGFGETEPSTLPAGPVISTVHVGPYDAMAPAYDALNSWLAAEDAEAAGPAWEIYLSEPAGDPATWRTQVVQPYRLGLR